MDEATSSRRAAAFFGKVPRVHRPQRDTAIHVLALLGVATLFSIFAWWPMLASYPATQTGDGPFFHKMIEAARVSVLRYHELPLWNPYECGGVPLWDNPQGVAAAPLTWLCLFVGTTRAIELWYILHSIAAVFCMWPLVRYELGLSRAASVVASLSWAFAGVHCQHLTGGHFVWVPYLYFPLAIFLWRRAETDLRMACGLGVLVALTIHEGGTYPLPHLVLLLGAETVTRLYPLRRFLAIARAAVVVVAVGFALGASRFLPVLDQLRSHTRPIGEEHDAMQWSTLVDVFLARTHERGVAGQEYVWPEFGDYLGPFVLALAFAGVFLAGRKRRWLLFLLVWSALLMGGHFASWAPWHVIKGHVYPFKEMRVPSRFVTAVSLFVSVYAAIGIDRGSELLGRLSRDRTARMLLLAVAFVGVGDLISVGMTWCAQCFNGPKQVPVVVSARLYYGGTDTAAFLDQPNQNRGRLDCWEEWAFEAGAPLWLGDVPQARTQGTNASVSAVTRTPNTFTLDVDAAQPARVLLNSTYDRGWRTNVGAVVRAGKQLALEVPAGHHHVRLAYWPSGLTLGLFMTALGWLGVFAYLGWASREKR